MTAQKTCYECADDYTVGKPQPGADRDTRIRWSAVPEDEIYAQERGWCSYACYDKAFKRNRARQLRAAAAAVRESEN